MDALPIGLTDGTWIVVGVAVLLLVGLIVGFYTRGGSGIEPHPRGRRRGGTAPGSHGRSEMSGRDEGERPPMQHGTR